MSIKKKMPAGSAKWRRIERTRQPGLIRACRQTREEGLPILYSHRQLRCQERSLKHLLAIIGSVGCQHIRSLRVFVPPSMKKYEEHHRHYLFKRMASNNAKLNDKARVEYIFYGNRNAQSIWQIGQDFRRHRGSDCRGLMMRLTCPNREQTTTISLASKEKIPPGLKHAQRILYRAWTGKTLVFDPGHGWFGKPKNQLDTAPQARKMKEKNDA